MLAINGADKVAAVDEAIRKIREQFSQPLVSANITLTDWLQNGLDVTFKTAQGSLRGGLPPSSSLHGKGISTQQRRLAVR